MGTEHKLDADLTWQADGHVGPAALSMLSDGEHALLDEGVLSHVDRCELCSARLGEAALFSLQITEDLALSAELSQVSVMAVAAEALEKARYQAEPLPPKNSRTIPVRAIGAALVLAVAGAAPSLISGVAHVRSAAESAVGGLSLLGRALFGLVRAVNEGGARAVPFVAVLSWCSAVFLLALGFAVAKVMSRRRLVEGEVG